MKSSPLLLISRTFLLGYGYFTMLWPPMTEQVMTVGGESCSRLPGWFKRTNGRACCTVTTSPCSPHHSRGFLHSTSLAFARGGNYFTRSSCRWANRFDMPSNVGLPSEIKLHTTATTPGRLVSLGGDGGVKRSVCTFAYRSLSIRYRQPPHALDSRIRAVW
ncbi:hypothetical protein LX36DRAFT_656522 [Colletotrichum falcatum]|nr:hypothetical protein LX36DRAFT_656522 [Colletotrichum falcatum]